MGECLERAGFGSGRSAWIACMHEPPPPNPWLLTKHSITYMPLSVFLRHLLFFFFLSSPLRLPLCFTLFLLLLPLLCVLPLSLSLPIPLLSFLKILLLFFSLFLTLELFFLFLELPWRELPSLLIFRPFSEGRPPNFLYPLPPPNVPISMCLSSINHNFT